VASEIEQPDTVKEDAFKWARSAMGSGDWRTAADRWLVLRSAFPDNPQTYFQATLCLMHDKQLGEAKDALDCATAKFSRNPTPILLGARLAVALGDNERANNTLLEVQRDRPSDPATWLTSAECYEDMGEIDAAAAAYIKMQQCDSEARPPYVKRAQLFMRAEMWGQALDAWKVVRNLFPDFPAGWIQASQAAKKYGDVKEARRLALAFQHQGIEDEESSLISEAPLENNFNKSISLRLIWTSAVLDLRAEVSRHVLSYAWWVIEPALHMAVYYMVFGMLLNRGGENYPVFLLAGLVPWTWFSKSVLSSSNSLLQNQNLILEVGVHPFVFPATSILKASLKQLPVFLLLFIFIAILGIAPNAAWLFLPLIILAQVAITIAFSSLIAAVIPFVRDLSYLVATGMMFMMFMSGIFFDVKNIAPEWQDAFLMNPMAFLIVSYREILLEGQTPDISHLAWLLMGGLSASVCAVAIFHKLRYVFPKTLLR
jgi:lipopolysaccharide transport system permease protein